MLRVVDAEVAVLRGGVETADQARAFGDTLPAGLAAQ